ncbi:MAG: hypothetical protein GY711_17710 [bacterium]|nr:hypothetical protein [bacterium]
MLRAIATALVLAPSALGQILPGDLFANGTPPNAVFQWRANGTPTPLLVPLIDSHPGGVGISRDGRIFQPQGSPSATCSCSTTRARSSTSSCTPIRVSSGTSRSSPMARSPSALPIGFELHGTHVDTADILWTSNWILAGTAYDSRIRAFTRNGNTLIDFVVPEQVWDLVRDPVCLDESCRLPVHREFHHGLLK